MIPDNEMRLLRKLERPGLGLGLSLGLSGGGLFNPAILFANGEQGAWFDPSDLASVFSDTAGTTAAVVGGTVARINDKSGRGNHATQASAASRPILRSGAGGYYLEFDGTDDWLATGVIDFSATDKITVWAGLRKIGASAYGLLVESGTAASGGPGRFGIFAPGGSPYNNYEIGLQGTNAYTGYSYAPYLAPLTNVLSTQYDIGGALLSDELKVRINGAAVTGSDAGTGLAAGSGNFASDQPLYIGRRAGTVIPFNGHIYGLMVRGGPSTSVQIQAVENWLNTRTRAY